MPGEHSDVPSRCSPILPFPVKQKAGRRTGSASSPRCAGGRENGNPRSPLFSTRRARRYCHPIAFFEPRASAFYPGDVLPRCERKPTGSASLSDPLIPCMRYHSELRQSLCPLLPSPDLPMQPFSAYRPAATQGLGRLSGACRLLVQILPLA